MRLIESMDDYMRDAVTYELANGERVCLSARDVQRYGAANMLRGYGLEVPSGRVPVTQDGRMVGNVPADFEPRFLKSRSFLYDVRPGDFIRSGDGWIASPQLGAGDLDAIEGFAPA